MYQYMEKDEMRRNDREITDKTLIEHFIAKEQIIRIAFYDNGDLYIVPLNYGYIYDNDNKNYLCCSSQNGNIYIWDLNNKSLFSSKSSPLYMADRTERKVF